MRFGKRKGQLFVIFYARKQRYLQKGGGKWQEENLRRGRKRYGMIRGKHWNLKLKIIQKSLPVPERKNSRHTAFKERQIQIWKKHLTESFLKKNSMFLRAVPEQTRGCGTKKNIKKTAESNQDRTL